MEDNRRYDNVLKAYDNLINEIEDRFMRVETGDNLGTSEGTTTAASGEILTKEQADKALENLKKRDRRSKFRRISDIRKLKIGDTVRESNGFPMKVTGIFQYTTDDYGDGVLYLDFDGNEGDVWEENLADVEMCGCWPSVLWKKLVRKLS